MPNGNYLVTLKFAEIYDEINPSNPRIFSVDIEGNRVITGLYLYDNPGPYIAYDRQFPVSVNDGILNIQFLKGMENPKISAIEIISYAPPAPTVTGIAPSTGVAGISVFVTNLAGTNFIVGSTPTVQLKNGLSTITATGVTVVNSNSITCKIPLPTTSAGIWDVVVTNPDLQSGTKSGAVHSYKSITNVHKHFSDIRPRCRWPDCYDHRDELYLAGLTSVTIGGAAATSVSVTNRYLTQHDYTSPCSWDS